MPLTNYTKPEISRRQAIIAILFGSFMLWGLGWDTVGRRLRLAVDGVVVAALDVPKTGAPRYATEYTIRGVDGIERIVWAGPTDGSLQRSMPVGTRLVKKRWHLNYERDGRTVEFPYVFYAVTLTISSALVVWGVIRYIRARPAAR